MMRSVRHHLGVPDGLTCPANPDTEGAPDSAQAATWLQTRAGTMAKIGPSGGDHGKHAGD